MRVFDPEAARQRHEAAALPRKSFARGRSASMPTSACGSSGRRARAGAAGSSSSNADAVSTRHGSTTPREYDVLLNYYRGGRGQPAGRRGGRPGGDQDDGDPPPARGAPRLLVALRSCAFPRRRRRARRGRHRRAVFRHGRERLDLAQPALTADSECAFAVPQAAAGAAGGLPGLVRRDHGAAHDPPRARGGRMGVRRDGQRLGNRSPARAGGAGRRSGPTASASSDRSRCGTRARSTWPAAPSTPTSAATGSIPRTRRTASSPTSASSGIWQARAGRAGPTAAKALRGVNAGGERG